MSKSISKIERESMKIFRRLLIGLMVIGMITYIILVQNNYVNFDKTIYSMVYIYISVIFIWIFIESIIYSIKDKNFLSGKIGKECNNKEKILKKVSSHDKNNSLDKKYCVNCHREIYSSNYTGSNLCVECKNYYYKNEKNK